MVLILVVTCIIMPNTPASASWSEYTAWSGWSAWQDTPVTETDLCDVETQSVIASTNYKTVYHYYRYASSEGASSGSYAQSSSYPNKYTYKFDSELETTTALNGHTRYKYWYSSSNWRGLYADSPYTTQEVVSHNYKTQYRYRTRSLIYYYTVSYNANGGSGAPSSQTKTGGTALTLSSTVPTKKFTITYNANGGSVSSSSKSVSCTFSKWKASNGSTYNKGGSYTTDADTTMTAQWTNPTAGTLLTPSRTGYTFKGWFTSASGGSQVTSSTTISANTTIYAQWTANTYSVKYNGNGNTSGSMSDSAHTYDSAKNLTTNTFTKTGYSFNGWNLKSDGTSTSYTDSASVKNLSATNSSTVNLYAQWEPNSYFIEYDGNGSTAGSMANTNCVYDDSTTLSANTYTRTHYVFNGWNTKADGSGTLYEDSANVINLVENKNETVILYAQWTLNEYTVSFDSNGGISAPKNQFKIHDKDLVICDELPKKTYKIKYDLNVNNDTVSYPDPIPTEQEVEAEFIRWNTEADGSGTTYYPGDSYKNNSPVTLYARWSPVKDVPLYQPIRNGYAFIGWLGSFEYIDEAIDTGPVSVTGEYTKTATIFGDLKLNAQWKAEKYTVILNANGGFCDKDEITVEFESLFGMLPIPKRTGYDFIGWFTSQADGTQITENTKVETFNDITLYAHWKPKDISSIKVDEDLTKTTYYIGDVFDSTEVVLFVVYADGETERVEEGFTCTEPILNKVSQKRVTVNYGGFSTFFTVNIVNPPIKNICVKTMPEKTEYFVGDTISDKGLSIEATHINGYISELTDGYELKYDFSSAGEKNVEVLYREGTETISTSFTVTVKSNPFIYSNVSEAISGEEFTVPVYISNNHGIMGFGFEIEYDDKVMAPISVESSSLLVGAFDNSITTVTDNKFKVYWTGSEDMTEDGLLFNVNFAVAENALGDYEIKINCITDDTFNEQWEPVKIITEPISVKIIDSEGTITKIYASNLKAKTGSTFEMPVYIANNTVQDELSVTISYDAEMFRPLSVSNGISNVTKNNIDSASGDLNLSLSEVNGNGILCTVLFYVEYGEANDYTFSLSSSSGLKCTNSTVFVSVGSAKIYSEKVAVADNIVTVPISILGNQGLMGFRLNFVYDDKVLSPVSVKMNNILASGMSENTIANSESGMFSVIWVGNDDITDNGILFALEFNLLDDSVDETSISVTYTQADTYNSEWKDVELLCNSISVSNKYKCPHNNTTINNAIASTCTVKGYTGDKVCSDCGEVLEHGYELALAEHNYSASVTPPTTSEQGYTTYICSVCGDSYISDYKDKIDVNAPIINVETVKGVAGREISIAISLNNNPGIVNMSLDVNYDESLTLIAVNDCNILGSAMHTTNYKLNPYRLTWANDTAPENYTSNGNVVILTFLVDEKAREGKHNVSVSYDNNNYDIVNYDFEIVDFAIINGGIEVVSYKIGDVNGDGSVNTADRMILSRYIAKWDGYEEQIVDMRAADINGDGNVNTADRMILGRYLAKWDGYESYFE